MFYVPMSMLQLYIKQILATGVNQTIDIGLKIPAKTAESAGLKKNDTGTGTP